jgi:hypothetical protein
MMKRQRCRATNVAVDGPLPVDERCVLAVRHKGLHECRHGFQFKEDLKLSLTGIRFYDSETKPRPRRKRT